MNLVLNNWQKRDEKGELVAENLKAQVQVTPYEDESWFYVATTEVEASGSGVPTLLLSIRKDLEERDVEQMGQHLHLPPRNFL